MKKMLAAALAVIMSICLLALPMNAQSGLNENEEKLLEYVEKEFETTQDGVFVKLPADMVAKATAYLSTDGLEISDAQFAAAEVQIIAIQDFIRTNLTVADGATELKLEDVSGDVYDGLLNIYTKLAEALNATVIIDENANRIVCLLYTSFNSLKNLGRKTETYHHTHRCHKTADSAGYRFLWTDLGR